MEEWDYEKNKELGLTPGNVSYGSKKKVYWVLPYDDSNTGKHFVFEWQATIKDRKNGIGCPYLANQAVWQGFNDLASQNKQLASEWHPTLNGNLKPTDIVVSSNKKVWWLCPTCGYSYINSVSKRHIRNQSCPECNDKGTSFPEFVIFFYLSKVYSDTIHRHKIQGIEFDIFIPSINTAIEYDGNYYHKGKIDKENQKDQFCKDNNIRFIRVRENKLELTKSAEIIWVKDRDNNDLNSAIVALFNILNISYDFEINIIKDNSSIMNLKRIKEIENSIAITHPELAAEWHPTKNGNLKPENFSHGSNIIVWWLCPDCGHEYQSAINNRTSGNGCVFCNKKMWTEEEIKILKKYYPTEGIKIQTRLPERSERAIKQKAQLLNIRNRSKILWTEEEIEILKKYYPSEGSIGIQKRLPNKPRKNIVSKANHLKIKNQKLNFKNAWTDIEDEIIKEYYSFEGTQISNKLPSRSKKAIKTRARILGIKYRKGADRNEDNL